MSIWIVLFLLCAIFGALGYAKGGVRMAVSLFGIFLGLFLATALSPTMRPILAAVGLKHPIWNPVFAPIVVFLLVWFVMIGVGFAIHHKLYLRYKYSADDLTRLRWERMNARVGLALGVFAGVTMLFAIGLVVYVLGYATLKISSEESNTALVKFFSKARSDMQQTGLDKPVATLDPSSPRYYEGIDVYSLIYHNPALQTRLTNYPPLIRLLEQPEVADAFADEEYRNLVFGKGSAFGITKHDKTKAILSSPALRDEYAKLDLPDLKEFLRTGKSPKFADTPLLGRWQLDPMIMLTQMRKQRPDLTANQIMTIRQYISPLSNATLIATIDNKLILSSMGAAAPEPVSELDPAEQEARDAEQEAARQLAERYGQTAPPGGARPAAPQGQQVAAAPVALPMFTGEGTWSGSGNRYTVTLPKPGGGETRGIAKIEGEEVTIDLPETDLFFYRIE